MVRIRTVLVAFSAVALFACSSADDGNDEQPSQSVEQAARKQCTVIAMCVEGYTWDEKTCRCRRTSAGGGEACGSRTCGAGEVCCNASCGICTPPGGFCTMQVCSSTEPL